MKILFTVGLAMSLSILWVACDEMSEPTSVQPPPIREVEVIVEPVSPPTSAKSPVVAIATPLPNSFTNKTSSSGNNTTASEATVKKQQPTAIPQKVFDNQALNLELPKMYEDFENTIYPNSYEDKFERDYVGSEVQLTGYIYPQDNQNQPFCLVADVVDSSNISEIWGSNISPQITFHIDELETPLPLMADPFYGFIELEGVISGFTSWLTDSFENYPCAAAGDLAVVVQPSSIKMRDRADIVPAILETKVNSKIKQWGISIELVEIHVAQNELRLYLSLLNDWDVEFDPGRGSDYSGTHDHLLLQHSKGQIRGLAIDPSKKVIDGLELSCEDDGPSNMFYQGCLEFPPGTEKDMVYLFKDPLASEILSGRLKSFTINFPSKEGYLPFERGVRDFAWELTIEDNGILSVTPLTEDLSTLPIIQTELVDIVENFENNPFTFMTNFEGRRFQLSGFIADIYSNFDGLPQIKLELGKLKAAEIDAYSSAGSGLYSFQYYITCDFNDPTAIYELGKGQEVTLIGLFSKGNLELSNCEVVE